MIALLVASAFAADRSAPPAVVPPEPLAQPAPEVHQVGQTEVRFVPLPGARKVALRSSRKRRRILPCIAPGCKNPSKGPRFHYLCEEHMGAPKKDYEAWREKRKEKEARA